MDEGTWWGRVRGQLFLVYLIRQYVIVNISVAKNDLPSYFNALHLYTYVSTNSCNDYFRLYMYHNL